MSERSFFRSTSDMNAELHKARNDSRQSLDLEERSIGRRHMNSVNSKAQSIQNRLQKIDSETVDINKQIYKIKQTLNELETRQEELQMEKNALEVQYNDLPAQYAKACYVSQGKTPTVTLDSLSLASSPPASSAGGDKFADMEAGIDMSRSTNCSYMGPYACPDLDEIMSQASKSRRKLSTASAYGDGNDDFRSAASAANWSTLGD